MRIGGGPFSFFAFVFLVWILVQIHDFFPDDWIVYIMIRLVFLGVAVDAASDHVSQLHKMVLFGICETKRLHFSIAFVDCLACQPVIKT